MRQWLRLWRRELPVDHSDHHPAVLLLRERLRRRLRLRQQLLLNLSVHKS